MIAWIKTNWPLLKKFLRPVGIACLVAGLLATIISANNHFHNIGLFFIIGLIFQFVFFAALSMILDWLTTHRTIKQAAELQADTLKDTLNSQQLNLECAYCQTINIVPIIISQANVFKCFSCKQDNSIQMKFFTARITVPVNLKSELDLMEHGLPDSDKEKINDQ